MVRNTNVLSVTTNTTLSLDYGNYLINAAAGSIVITIPTLTNNGTNWWLFRTDTNAANTVTVTSTNPISGNINIPINGSLYVQGYNNTWTTSVSNGTQGPQ